MSSDRCTASSARHAGERKRGEWLAIACLIAAFAAVPSSRADERVTLAASPGTCVALHKGQPCFRRIVIRWSVPDDGGRYCLRLVGRDEPLACWSGAVAGRHEHDYGSPLAERYALVAGDGGDALAETIVRTAWVHRTNRRGASGWRLF